MKIAGTNIDRPATIAFAVLGLIWLMCVGVDIKLYMDWATGLPKFQHNWQGCLFMSFGVIAIPCYIALMLKPPAWMAKWAMRA